MRPNLLALAVVARPFRPLTPHITLPDQSFQHQIQHQYGQTYPTVFSLLVFVLLTKELQIYKDSQDHRLDRIHHLKI